MPTFVRPGALVAERTGLALVSLDQMMVVVSVGALATSRLGGWPPNAGVGSLDGALNVGAICSGTGWLWALPEPCAGPPPI